MANAHYVYLDEAAAWSLSHPSTCNPPTCPYIGSVTTQEIDALDRPEEGSVAVYKVTGTSSPTFAREDDEEVVVSAEEESKDPEVTYDLIEDREAYDVAIKEAAGEVDHPEGEQPSEPPSAQPQAAQQYSQQQGDAEPEGEDQPDPEPDDEPDDEEKES